MRNLFIALCLCACVLGCSTTGTQYDVPPAPAMDVAVTADPARSVICVGLDYVDPNAYGGWNGECPGCTADAQSMYSLFTSNGFSGRLMLNSAATWACVRAALREAAAKLPTNGLLVLTISSHGGQVPDYDGDEADGLDETLCLWDGQVVDDKVLELIGTLPQLRLLIINDQCHSEGNFRQIMRKSLRTLSLGRFGNIEARPLSAKNVRWRGQIIQYAGCRENSYSYGTPFGGTWTQTLLYALETGPKTWREWFDVAAYAMPERQKPVWVTYGNVTPEFADGEILK